MYGAQGNAYQQSAVTTAGPAQLVTMCYDGTLGAIARAQHPEATPETVNREIQRAQDIVTELLLGLDHDRGGQVAAGLAALYRYCLEELLSANIRKDPSRLQSVVDVIAPLREAWTEATATYNQTHAAAG